MKFNNTNFTLSNISQINLIRGVAKPKFKCRPKLGVFGGMPPWEKKCIPRMALVPFDVYLKDISTHFLPNLYTILKIM